MRWLWLLFGALVLTACRDTATVGDTLPPDERIVILLPEGVRGVLDPRLNTRAWPGKIMPLVYEGLVSINNPQLTPEPALAERIDQPSPRVYDITLRTDARFHDGTPVRPEDVRATFESARDPALRSPRKSVLDRIETLEILGPRRLRITLERPHAPFITDLSIGIIPAAHIGPDGALKGPPIGAGPYRFKAQRGQEELVLERFDGYFRGVAPTRYLVFRTIRDQNTRLLALMGGAADLIENGVTPRMADAMRSRTDLAVDTTPGVAYTYLAFNLRSGPLADVRVRRAIAHAIDRSALIAHKFRGVARPASGMLPAGHWAYNGAVAQYPHDPQRARALLDAAGYPARADGPRFRLSYKTNTDKFRRNLARLIAVDLAAVGIELDVQAFELGTLLADVKSGNFDLYMLQWGDPSEPHMYNWIFHSDRIPTAQAPNRGGNRGAYRNAEVDRLIDAGRDRPERAARRGVYQRLQEILADELPYLSLWHEDVVVIRRVGLKGYQALPHASFYGLWQASWR